MSGPDKAREFEEQGDKRQKKFQPFGNSKFEDAYDLYCKSGNLYKLNKLWKNAGDVFQKAARCQIKLQNKFEAATSFMEAANCYKKDSPQDAIDMSRLAIDIYVEMGKFTMAARQERDIAEMLEAQYDLQGALDHYKTAADFWAGEESTSNANQCNLKVAHLHAELGNYNQAAELFESIAAVSVDNTLLRFSVREYLLKAGICRLCTNDLVNVRRHFDRYLEMDPSFVGSREQKLLESMLEAVEKGDADRFATVVFEYDKVTKLNAWQTKLLLAIKKNIGEAGDVPGAGPDTEPVFT